LQAAMPQVWMVCDWSESVFLAAAGAGQLGLSRRCFASQVVIWVSWLLHDMGDTSPKMGESRRMGRAFRLRSRRTRQRRCARRCWWSYDPLQVVATHSR
jgi:hypothetical protein